MALNEEQLVIETAYYENMKKKGLRLADTPMAEGGWREYFMESEDADDRIEDDTLRSHTAIMLENAKVWLAGGGRAKRVRDGNGSKYILTEATRSALVGGFSDYLFPIIRAAFPTNPINDLVSVQPTNRRTATVIYWNYIYGSNKGDIYAGQRAFDANVGKPDAETHYSDGFQNAENTGVAANNTTTYSCTLKYNDGGGIVPGSVSLATTTSGGASAYYDNGNGGFTATFTGGGALTGTNTINYTNGQIVITIEDEIFTGAAVVAAYWQNTEGSALTPQMDVQIITTTTETKRRALRVLYSMEALFDVNAEFGVDLEPNLVTGCAEQVNYEIAREIVGQIWAVAPVVATFPTTPAGPYVSLQQHFMDLGYYLTLGSNAIWAATQKAYGNFIIVDSLAASIIEASSGSVFQAEKVPDNVMGIHFIGTYGGKFRVYKDVHLSSLPVASEYGNILMGHKSEDFMKAGLVFSPYQMFYTTETLMTADFNAQKGLASRYATKMVSPAMYVRVSIGE